MTLALGLLLGAAFGALLQLSGASSHTKIVNALRLKDLTIMKLILMAIGVGVIGVHVLDLFGLANMKVKDLYLLGIIAAGAIFGVGFALSGYCPGTALAACAEGKPDALATVIGGFCGALVFAFMFPDIEEHLLAVGRYGPVTIPSLLGIHGIWIAVPLGIVCIWLAIRLPEPGGRDETHRRLSWWDPIRCYERETSSRH